MNSSEILTSITLAFAFKCRSEKNKQLLLLRTDTPIEQHAPRWTVWLMSCTMNHSSSEKMNQNSWLAVGWPCPGDGHLASSLPARFECGSRNFTVRVQGSASEWWDSNSTQTGYIPSKNTPVKSTLWIARDGWTITGMCSRLWHRVSRLNHACFPWQNGKFGCADWRHCFSQSAAGV